MMIEVYQTVLHDPPRFIGNCFRACVASVMEIGIDKIPAFEHIMYHGGGNWVDDFISWADLNGYDVQFIDSDHEDLEACIEGQYSIAMGVSTRFADTNHCVVFYEQSLVFDPHPDNDGLREPPFEYILIHKRSTS